MAKNHHSTALFLRLLLFLSFHPSQCQDSSVVMLASATAFSGEWRLLHASIGIPAMHIQLLPGDKFVMFDRTDTGPSNLSLPSYLCATNSSGDCTAHSLLYDLPTSSITPVPLLSDPWCSSAALLPNGSLIQSGGFKEGDRTLRSISSISTQWDEIPGYLSSRRWYASDQLLPDGRVIILGGRRQFSYEFFPRDPIRSAASTTFPFLVATHDPQAENNLYPFLHLLPDGSLFVFANSQAVLVDVSAANTSRRKLRRLPDMPGGDPRNYPSSGSSALLPLRPPSYAAEVLICGGAPRGGYQAALNGTFLPALRTCGRIAPLGPNPTWEVEEMPSPRVMGDMVLLPTCDVILLNGAAAGTAGWELATDPATTPVLYRPGSAAGTRFTILSPATIPRLYHSAAALDTYGRILVGGSNPHVGYNFTNVTYPTELSLEAFHPPYLDPALDHLRPRITAVPGGAGGGEGLGAAVSVGYGEDIGVRFTVQDYRSSGVAAVAIAPPFATHSVGMNQRAVVLGGSGRVTQVGRYAYELEVAAPPAPEIAPPGYYVLFLVHAGVPSRGAWVKFLPGNAA